MTTKQEAVVSILTPCYNGGRFLHRLLDSILAQTYPYIELIVVDDGSTDNTRDVLVSYQDKFDAKEMRLVVLHQENAGQAAAINTALAQMTGDYLTWFDADDFMHADSIEKRVDALKASGEGWYCITHYNVVDEADVTKVLYQKGRVQAPGDDKLFYDLIDCKNVAFESGGGFMVRTKDFLKACPANAIYPSREGQNWQLMLPIAYYNRCICLEEALYTVVSHADSHSRMRRTKEDKIRRHANYITLLSKTVEAMQIPEEQKAVQHIEIEQTKEMIAGCFFTFDIPLAKKYIDLMGDKYGTEVRRALWKQTVRKMPHFFMDMLRRSAFLRKLLKRDAA